MDIPRTTPLVRVELIVPLPEASSTSSQRDGALKAELMLWLAALPDGAPELARINELRQSRSAAPEDEPLLSLKDLTAALGYKHSSALWKLGVREVAEDWAGRPRYRKSDVVRYLKSDKCQRRREEWRMARRNRQELLNEGREE